MNDKHIIAIDPGPERSALVEYWEEKPVYAEIIDNEGVRDEIIRRRNFNCHLVIEMIASYGMPVGKEIFDTCVWIGRFIEAAGLGVDNSLVYRKDVKLHLCGSARAKDSNIRQALIDRFGPGKKKAIGTKASQGPLYGFKKDLWAALAVAVTYSDLRACSSVG